MFINIDSQLFELAIKTIKNEPLDRDDELDFWLYHFNIKYDQVCKKYNLKNKGYNFFIHILIKFYQHNCICYFWNNHSTCGWKDKFVTKSNFYNYIFQNIEYFNYSCINIEFVIKSYRGNIENDEYDIILKDYLKKIFNLSKIFFQNIKNEFYFNEIMECYNLKIKFKFRYRAFNYVSVRKN